jgi:hypothetical protein
VIGISVYFLFPGMGKTAPSLTRNRITAFSLLMLRMTMLFYILL